ncbi:MAG: acyl carrier protein [Fibrobacter sp.]|jgi:acyl carrier protein|nr:acyl carrier protein [Fibrobacter sp.]
MNDELKKELKELIISELALEDVSVDDIRDDQPIFNEGLGLDSIDALELGVAIQKKYGVKLKGKSDEEVKSYFSSINSLSDFISRNLNQATSQ